MIKKAIGAILFSFLAAFNVQAQSYVGKWKIIDDATGKAKSIVEITEVNGVLSGRVLEIVSSTQEARCQKCVGDLKNKPVLGLTIITGMTRDSGGYSGGKILDPESGKMYKCILKLNGRDKLDVRGYVGVQALGRTQTWVRLSLAD